MTADPHALHVLRRHEYPAFGGRFEVLHHSALLDALVQNGPLHLSPQVDQAVAYHDPCYLARYNGETDAPRRLLLAASRTITVEMGRHGTGAMCCSGGGGAAISDIQAAPGSPACTWATPSHPGRRVAVGCPGCTAILEGVPGRRPEVRDLAELVLAAVSSINRLAA